MSPAPATRSAGPDAASLRICMAATSYPRWEGDYAGHFVGALASAIADLGHQVTVVAPHDPGALETEVIDGVEVRRFRYAPEGFERVAFGDGILSNLRHDPRAWAALPGFARALRGAVAHGAEGADLVHAHWAPTAALGRTGRLGRPAVLTVHGSDVSAATGSGPLARLLARGVGEADAVIAVSRRLAETLGGMRTPPGRVEVIANGVPAELVERERPEREAGAARLLYVGRLIEGKGVDDLMEAFLRLEGDVTLTFIGDGPRRDALAAAAEQAGASGRVRFTGRVDHSVALDEMARADCLILPSYAEGCPLCVLEALAVGTPVVGSTVGAIPDFLPAEALHEPGDVDRLEILLERLAGDARVRREWGERGRELVASRYTWPSVAERTVRLYREVLS